MSRFFINRGVQSGNIPANSTYDPFNLPCHGAVEGETAAMFNAQIDSAETQGRWLIFLIHTIAPTSQIWYAPIDISVISDSVAHAKSLSARSDAASISALRARCAASSICRLSIRKTPPIKRGRSLCSKRWATLSI